MPLVKFLLLFFSPNSSFINPIAFLLNHVKIHTLIFYTVLEFTVRDQQLYSKIFGNIHEFSISIANKFSVKNFVV